MKILIDARFYGTEHSGLGRYTANLIEELIKIESSHKFTVLLRKKYFNQLNFGKNWKKVRTDIPHYTLREQVILPGVILKESPDLVHFPHLNVPVRYNKPFVVTIHDIIMHKQGANATTLPLPLYYAKRIPYKIVANHAAKLSCRIIVPSNTVKEEVVRYFNISASKVVVTYEGFKNDFANRSQGQGDLKLLSTYGLKPNEYFFYVGNAYPHKNLERAVHAITLLNNKRNKNLIFVIGGTKDAFKTKLEKVILTQNAQHFVKLIGHIPDKDLPIIYKNAVGFLYPSVSEGFGLQGLEAIASGTPLIASELPVFKEIFKNNAIYFDPYNTETMVDAMQKAVTLRPKEKEKIIDEGRKFIQKYSWEKMARETLNIYEKV